MRPTTPARACLLPTGPTTRRAAAALTLLVAACTPHERAPRVAPTPPDDRPAALVEALGGGGAAARQAASALQRRAPEVVPFLIESLRHPRKEVRFGLIQLLSRLDDPRTIPALVERVVRDPSAHVRYRTLAALKAGPVARDGRPAIVAALRRWHIKTVADERWNAAYALASMGEQSALDEMRAALRGDDDWRQIEAVWALAFIPDESVAGDVAAQLDKREGPQLWSVIDTLAEIPGAVARAALSRAAEGDDPTAAERARRALRNRPRRAAQSGDPPPRTPGTQQATSAPDAARARPGAARPVSAPPGVERRWQEASTAGAARAVRRADDLAKLALTGDVSDAGWSLFWRAVWALKRTNLGTHQERRLAAAVADRDRVVSLRAAVALAHIGRCREDCRQALAAALHDGAPPHRTIALDGLTASGDRRALDAALDWLRTGDEPARRAAAETLARWPPEPAADEGLVWALLRDPSPAIRWRAALWLGRRGGERARLALATALRFEPDDGVRQHLRDSLAALGSRPAD